MSRAACRAMGLAVFLALGLSVSSADFAEAAPNRTPAAKSSGGSGLYRPFGLGLQIGEPTGPVFKLWLPDHRAIDGGLAFSLRNFFMIYADYLFHFPQGFGTSSEFLSQVTPYVGVGGVLFFSTKTGRVDRALYTQTGDSTAFGVRIPLGAEWMIPKSQFGLFAELVPGVGFFPSTFAFLQGGIGIRFYF